MRRFHPIPHLSVAPRLALLAATLRLSGTDTSTGPTAMNAGTLQLGASAALSSTIVTLAHVAGATLDLNGFDQTISRVQGGGATGGNVLLGSAMLTPAFNRSGSVMPSQPRQPGAARLSLS